MEESTLYNNLLFRFMDFISLNNKDHLEYLTIFIEVLSYYRSKGFYLLKENSYKEFINIFSYVLLKYNNINIVIKI